MSDNSDNFGDLINGLLTGGILIGKICQALGGGPLSKRYVDQESGITVIGAVSSGGVKFFRSNSDGIPKVYAFNPDTSSHVMVTIPNGTDTNGVVYVLRPTQKLAVGEVDSPLVPPTVNVTTGPIDAPSASLASEAGLNSLFKLAFSGLRIGNTVRVGSFKLSCTTQQLTIVSTEITAVALTYLYVNSDKGVTATSQTHIPPTSQTGMNDVGVIEQHFAIDFASLGIDMTSDTVDGQVTLEAASSGSDLAKLSKVPSEPLHPAEREFFARLSRGEL